jgi:urease accessory protein
MLVWQLADSAFPTGGFAHSAGLEAAWQAGEVPSPEHLKAFIRESLWQAGRGQLPLASSAYEAPARLQALDALCQAFLTNVVSRRASCVQGRAMAATCARIWPGDPMSALEAEVRGLHGHYAPIFGVCLCRLGVPLDQAQSLFLFLVLRGLTSAAVRLGIVGPYASQRLQFDCSRDVNIVHARCTMLRDTDIAQTAPLLDLLQASHDRLYSRLFVS